MRCNFKILISALSAATVATPLQAIIPEATAQQYQGIPERNVFGLRPPASQPEPTNVPAALPKITLTGITTILDSKRALMKVTPTGPKSPEAGKELSLILTEGQREGDIEVLQINELAGSVKVNNSGTVMMLTFEKDGAKLPASSAQPGQPGSLPLPTALPANPATNPINLPGHNIPGLLPGRGQRFPTLPGVAGATGGTVGTVPAVGGVPTPTGAVPVPTPAVPTTPSIPTQDLTPEEQAIVMEIQRQANPNNSALLPPTALTPSPASSNGSTPAVPGVPPPIPGRPTNLVPQ